MAADSRGECGNRDNRRAFLKSAAAAAVQPPWHPTSPPGPTSPNPRRPASRSVTLGKTGRKVSVLGMGTSWDVAPSFVQAALFAGVRYIDTSETYEERKRRAHPW